MVIVAEFTVPSTDFPLGSIFTVQPNATVELECVVPTKSALVPYFWVRGATKDAAIDSFESVPGIQDILLVDEVEGEYLFRVMWDAEVSGILRAVIDAEVSVLSAVGSNQQWIFEIRAEQPTDIRQFEVLCREYNVPVELTNLHSLTPKNTSAELTETQEEALILAYQRGYYESPQRTTLNEIAKELDITGQSLGSRLRRGIQQLIESTLIQPTQN